MGTYVLKGYSQTTGNVVYAGEISVDLQLHQRLAGSSSHQCNASQDPGRFTGRVEGVWDARSFAFVERIGGRVFTYRGELRARDAIADGAFWSVPSRGTESVEGTFLYSFEAVQSQVEVE